MGRGSQNEANRNAIRWLAHWILTHRSHPPTLVAVEEMQLDSRRIPRRMEDDEINPRQSERFGVWVDN